MLVLGEPEDWEISIFWQLLSFGIALGLLFAIIKAATLLHLAPTSTPHFPRLTVTQVQ